MKALAGIAIMAVGCTLAWMLPGLKEANVSFGYTVLHNVLIMISAIIAFRIWGY